MPFVGYNDHTGAGKRLTHRALLVIPSVQIDFRGDVQHAGGDKNRLPGKSKRARLNHIVPYASPRP